MNMLTRNNSPEHRLDLNEHSGEWVAGRKPKILDGTNVMTRKRGWAGDEGYLANWKDSWWWDPTNAGCDDGFGDKQHTCGVLRPVCISTFKVPKFAFSQAPEVPMESSIYSNVLLDDGSTARFSIGNCWLQFQVVCSSLTSNAIARHCKTP